MRAGQERDGRDAAGRDAAGRDPAGRDPAGRDEPPRVGRDEGAGGGRISRWEWLAAALGLLVVASFIGFLVWEAATGDGTPPAVTVAVDSVSVVPGGHLVHVRARNSGDRAAAGVVVEGRLEGADAGPETSEATLDYVPGRSERRGGLFFEGDPRAGRLTLRALGYAEP